MHPTTSRWSRARFSPAAPQLDVLALDSTWYWLGDGQLLAVSVRRRPGPPTLLRTPLQLAWEWDGWLGFNRDRTGLWVFADGMPGAWKLWPRRAPVQALPVVGGQALSTRSISRLADGRLVVGSYAGTFTQAADSPLAPLRRWPGMTAGPGPGGAGPPAHRRRWPAVVPENVWFCSLRLPDGRLLLGLENERNLWLRTGARFEEITWAGPHPNPTGTSTFCLLRTRAGQLWAGGQQGLFVVDLAQRTRTRYREADAAWPLHHCDIEALSEGADGELWLATSRGLYGLRPATGALRHYGPDEAGPRYLPTGLLRCVLFAHPDSLWVGTLDAGLLLLHPGRGVRRQLTLGQGLPSEAVAFVQAPPPGRVLWVGTGAGLVRYDPRTGRRSDLTTAEGLAANELNRQSSWYDAPHQRLYVGGVGGLSWLTPGAPAVAAPPPRLLLASLTQHHAQPDTIRTDYLPGTLPQGLRLAPGDAFADLALALSDDDGPEPGRFAYRLLGSSGSAPWQELGPDNHLRLQGLAPGDYTLELKGETGQGTPTRRVLRVPVQARTYWWRRPGTWGALTALLAGLVGAGVYGWQQRRARRRWARWQAEQALRQRLAADLHDEVGSLLTQVSLQSDGLRALAPAASPLHPRLDALAATARYAAQQMTEVVLSLQEPPRTLPQLLPQLLARLRDHAYEVLSPAEVEVRFEVPAVLPAQPLPAEVLHALYLVYKEALHNVVKHAQATQVSVTLSVAPAALTLRVADDGRGYAGAPRPGGQGLRNMQARAQAVGGSVRYYPAAPSGRTVEVQLPL